MEKTIVERVVSDPTIYRVIPGKRMLDPGSSLFEVTVEK